MRELCVDLVMTSHDMSHTDHVAYARKRVVRYFAMASFVGDRYYVERFKGILANHVERSETITRTTDEGGGICAEASSSKRTPPGTSIEGVVMNYQRWEYYVHDLYPHELQAGLLVTLNDQGREGWEAVAILPGSPEKVLFKRPLSE